MANITTISFLLGMVTTVLIVELVRPKGWLQVIATVTAGAGVAYGLATLFEALTP